MFRQDSGTPVVRPRTTGKSRPEYYKLYKDSGTWADESGNWSWHSWAKVWGLTVWLQSRSGAFRRARWRRRDSRLASPGTFLLFLCCVSPCTFLCTLSTTVPMKPHKTTSLIGAARKGQSQQRGHYAQLNEISRRLHADRPLTSRSTETNVGDVRG